MTQLRRGVRTIAAAGARANVAAPPLKRCATRRERMGSGKLERGLRLVLEKASGERDCHQTLRRDSCLLLINAFNTSWNFSRCFPEFQLGADFVADYLIISADSGAWNAIFLELESPRARIFNQRGTPSRQAAVGLRQLDDWERWLAENAPLFRESLSKLLERENIPAYCSRADIHTLAHTEIRDPRTVIRTKFILVIGRRQSLSQLDQARRGPFASRNREISTYDRLLDAAQRLDARITSYT